jgi:hypothetical protein
MPLANFEQRPNGGGAGRQALAPTVLVDEVDELLRHGNGDARRLQPFLDHALIMRAASRLHNSPNARDAPAVRAV